MKDLINKSVGIFCLFMLSPVLISLAVMIRVKLGTPVFFKQIRPGLHGTPFTIYKFRTMTEATDEDGLLLPDVDRLTPVGRFLRSTSLDELPELFNIAKGDMNLVGPRPLLMQYLDRYTPEQARRHDVKPGLTGWAQVNGRNILSWEEKFRLDVWYVDHQTIRLDFKILLMTFKKVLQRDGISAQGEATAAEFFPKKNNTTDCLETNSER